MAPTPEEIYARTKEEGKRRLIEASGAQFDPQVVDALLRVLD